VEEIYLPDDGMGTAILTGVVDKPVDKVGVTAAALWINLVGAA